MAEKRQPTSTRYSDSGNRSFEWLKENYTWLAAMVVLVAGCLACLVIACMEGEAVARQYEERACQLRLEINAPGWDAEKDTGCLILQRGRDANGGKIELCDYVGDLSAMISVPTIPGKVNVTCIGPIRADGAYYTSRQGDLLASTTRNGGTVYETEAHGKSTESGAIALSLVRPPTQKGAEPTMLDARIEEISNWELDESDRRGIELMKEASQRTRGE